MEEQTLEYDSVDGSTFQQDHRGRLSIKGLDTQCISTDFQEEGNPCECSSYRIICFLCHATKIFEHVLEKRILYAVEMSRN